MKCKKLIIEICTVYLKKETCVDTSSYIEIFIKAFSHTFWYIYVYNIIRGRPWVKLRKNKILKWFHEKWSFRWETKYIQGGSKYVDRTLNYGIPDNYLLLLVETTKTNTIISETSQFTQINVNFYENPIVQMSIWISLMTLFFICCSCISITQPVKIIFAIDVYLIIDFY